MESYRNSSPEFQADSGRIPLEFCWNPPELLLAFCWHSTGIPAGIPPEFRRNCCRHSTGIALEFQPEFRRNYCQHSTGISTGIPAEILPEWLLAFRRNSAGIIAGIPLIFRTTPAGIPGLLLVSPGVDYIVMQQYYTIYQLVYYTCEMIIKSHFIKFMY